MASEFQSNIDAYVAQTNDYKDQLNVYKNELINSANEKKDQLMQVGLSTLPLVVQGAGTAVTALAGSTAGSAFSQVATPEAIQALIKGDASVIINNMQTLSKAKVLAGMAQEGEAVTNPVADLLTSLKSAGSIQDVGNALATTVKASLGVSEEAGTSILGQASALASKALATAGGEAESGIGSLVSQGLSKLSSLSTGETGIGLPTSVDEITSAVSSVLSKVAPLDGFLPAGADLSTAVAITTNLPSGAGAFVNLSGLAGESATIGNTLSSISEPVASIVATTSNNIGRAINMARGLIQAPTEVVSPESSNLLSAGASWLQNAVSGAPKTVLSEAGTVAETSFSDLAGAPSDLVSSALATGEQAVATASGLAEGAVANLTSTVTSGITGALAGSGEGIAGAIGSTLATVAGEGTAGAVAGGLASALGEGATAEAVGAGFGPVGLVVGGLVTLGTILASVFGHHDSKPVVPIQQAPDSIPVFQAGLNTAN